jgi:hypothetical protein
MNETTSHKSDLIELNKLSKRLQQLYETRRRLIEPKYRQSAKRFESSWMKVAQLVKSINADPVAYIESQFIVPNGYGLKPYPYPNQMYGDIALSKYKQLQKRPNSPFEMAFNTQISYVKNLQSTFNEKSLDEILSDPLMPIKNFTRVMLCSSEAYEEIFNTYGKEAQKELQSEVGLSEHIKKNYESRYKRIFRERLPAWTGSEHSEDPGPPSKIKRGQTYSE